MKRTIQYGLLIWMVLMADILPLQAQQAKTFFVSMPDTILPLLTEINRADCIDFLESNMRAQVTNRLDGKSEMTKLTDDYIAMNLSSQSRWQMKLLALNDSTQIICTVTTVCSPACDSHIRFYTTKWESLPMGNYIKSLPVLNDFLPELSEESSDIPTLDALKQADMLLVDMQLSADDDTLTCLFDTPRYMSDEAAKKLKPLLKEPVVYTWSSGLFVRK